MDDIGNYIYLILVALAGLSSFFKNKKKQTEVVTDDEDDEKRSFGDEWKDIFKEPETESKKTEIFPPYTENSEPVVQPVVNEVPKKQSYNSYENTGSDFSMLKAKKTIEPKKQIVLADEVEDDEGLQFSLESASDIRNAIIANEVLNRKYI